MSEAIVFLTDGFEEIEALTVVDILRRGGVDVATVSLTGDNVVIGSHDISVIADAIFPDFNADTNTVLILPGGPGTSNYKTNEPLLDYLRNHYTAGGKVAAICAAPTVLGTLGILEGKKACCYPGFEHELLGADICDATAIVDGNIITGRSAGASIEFALAVLTEIKGKITADTVREKLVM